MVRFRQKKPTTVELLSRNEGKGCGECKFFTDETTDGAGLCVVRKTAIVKYCGDKACAWFRERGMVSVTHGFNRGIVLAIPTLNSLSPLRTTLPTNE